MMSRGSEMVEESQKCRKKRGEEKLRIFELFFPLIVSILTKLCKAIVREKVLLADKFLISINRSFRISQNPRLFWLSAHAHFKVDAT